MIGAMSGPVTPVVRGLVVLLAVITALAGALQALVFVSFSHPLLLLGTVGAVAASMILVRVEKRGALPNRMDAALLVLGIVASVAGFTVFARRPEWTLQDSLVVTMKSDLRNLVTAEDAYFTEHGVYAGTLSDLGARYRANEGVNISLDASGPAFQASARHDRVTRTCAIFVGATPIAPAVEEREPACTPKP